MGSKCQEQGWECCFTAPGRSRPELGRLEGAWAAGGLIPGTVCFRWELWTATQPAAPQHWP